MLLRAEGQAVVAIGQASHSWLSGQLARGWGNDRFPLQEPHEAVCLAAEQHDIGMAEWDLRPALNPETGRPYSFIEMPVAIHLELWSRAPAKLMTQSRYAALLVSMHGTALAKLRNPERLSPRERELVSSYVDAQRAFQAELAGRLGVDLDRLATNQRLIWTWDGLSLAVCLRWPPFTAEDVPSRGGPVSLTLEETEPGRLTLDPWPFRDDRVVLRCEGVRLDERFDDEAELHAALGRGPVVELTFTLERSG
jgi:Protein of unknown function (DUF3891)